jgi:hypothetical protein
MSSKTFTLHEFGRAALKLSVSDDGTCSTFAVASVGGEIRVTMHEWAIASVAYNAKKHRPEILTELEQSGFSELARQVRSHVIGPLQLRILFLVALFRLRAFLLHFPKCFRHVLDLIPNIKTYVDRRPLLSRHRDTIAGSIKPSQDRTLSLKSASLTYELHIPPSPQSFFFTHRQYRRISD